jgi:acetyl esterase/lipase
MPLLKIRHLSHSTLQWTNLFGITSLKKVYDWELISHEIYASKNGVDLLCDVYLPYRIGLRPAVLVVHGGGWSSRSREDMHFYSEQLAGQGFVVVNCSYRLAPEHLFPSAVEDVRDAYNWMIQNSRRFQIDQTNIGALGYSAGAHIVTLLSSWASVGKNGFHHIKFKMVAGGGGVYDFMVYPLSPYIKRFTSFYRDQNPELYLDASPLHRLGEDLPHFFLFHAEKDELVEHDQMVRFAREVKLKGGSIETHTVSKLSHIFTFLFGLHALQKTILAFKKHLSNK